MDFRTVAGRADANFAVHATWIHQRTVGMRCDLAVLQASADGAPIYRRLGFEPFGQIVEYKPAP